MLTSGSKLVRVEACYQICPYFNCNDNKYAHTFIDFMFVCIGLVNHGGLAEQYVGQALRLLFPPYVEPFLYYWQREDKSSTSEVDYLISIGTRVIPVEVKAGKTGSLRSLHYFVHLKKLEYAVRINADLPSITQVDTNIYSGERVQYQLMSIPFYLIGQLNKLLEECIK